MTRYGVLFFFLIAVQISYAQTNKEKALNNVKQALIFEDNGKLNEALKLLEEAVKFDSESLDISYELAVGYYTNGDFNKAKDILEKLLVRKDVIASVYHLLGNTYDKLANVEKSIATYLNGITKFPEAGELYLEMGTMYLSRKEYSPAIAYYEKGIQSNPAFASNYYWAAKIFCNSDEAVWGMIYGELFLNLERNSKRTDEISKLLFDTYKKKIRFPRDSIFQVNFSKPGTYVVFDTARNKKKTPFSKAVYEPTLMLALLNEKNIDMNSLARIRKYFVESYFKSGTYQNFPNVLFDFQYRVLKAGHWDAYSRWILFKGDEAAGNQWVNANKQKWDNFVKWFLKNKLLLDNNYKFYSNQYD